jgi:hypothetical protein
MVMQREVRKNPGLTLTVKTRNLWLKQSLNPPPDGYQELHSEESPSLYRHTTMYNHTS